MDGRAIVGSGMVYLLHTREGQAGFPFAGRRKQPKIIQSCKRIVHIFCCDLSLQNLRQQGTKTKAGIS